MSTPTVFEGLVDQLLADASSTGPPVLDETRAAALLALAAGVFAQLQAPYRREVIAGLDMPPTVACTSAAALLRAQSLTPFEFNVWFSQARVGNQDELDADEETTTDG